MEQSAKDALAIAREAARRDDLPGSFDFHCAGPGCTNVLRKPRMITVGTTVRCNGKSGSDHVDTVVPLRRVHWSWCSQACFDAWNAQYVGRIPGTRWAVYDQDHVLVGFVVPGRGRVSLAEIEAAQQGAKT